MSPTAATRDLWVAITGPTRPEYGLWLTPTGKPVHETLGVEGPPGVEGVDWYFGQPKDHRGVRLVDALWQYGFGLKVYSERLCAVLESCGAVLRTWPADVRMKDGTSVDGYLAVLEDADVPGPVHSMWHGRRAGRVTVSDEVREAVVGAGLTGIKFGGATSAFPGEDGFCDEST